MENTKNHSRLLLEDPEVIVYQALQTLGLTKGWLAELMGISELDLPRRLNIKELKGCEWYRISSALYLPGDSISFGYFRMSHKANIRWALRDGYCYLPRSWGLWKLRFEIWQDVLRDVRFQSKHYGFRLRWKARYQDFSKWFKQKIKREHRAYNPVVDARDYFHPETEERKSFRPGLAFQFKKETATERELTLS
jgi:hypothetical protein